MRFFNSNETDNKKILKRMIIVILSVAVVIGITKSIFPDWTLRADEVSKSETEASAEQTDGKEGSAEDAADADDGAAESTESIELKKPADSDVESESPKTEEDRQGADSAGSEESGAAEAPASEGAGNAESENTSEEADGEYGESDADANAEDKSTKGNLIFEGGDYIVTVIDSKGILPEGTFLSVDEISGDSREYEKYCSDAIDAINEADKGGNESEIGFARFYDIKLISGGKEIEPDDSIQISITYEKALRKELVVEEESNLHIVHFSENEKSGDTEAVILEGRDVELEIKKNLLGEASFEADSFSVYGIVYSVEKEGSMKLSQTDAVYYRDMSELLTDLVLYIDGDKVTDGSTIEVRDGMLYDLKLTFQEGIQKQFSNDEQLYFKLPDGFTLPEGFSDKITINLGIDGKVYNNKLSYDPATNRLLLDWNTDSNKIERLKAAGNLKFTLHLRGYVNPGIVSYPGYFTATAERYDPHNASVAKTGVLDASDPEHQTITYTITVVSDGSTENLTLTDTPGTALSYRKADGITWKRSTLMDSQTERNTPEAPVSTAKSDDAPYFKYTKDGMAISIPEMHDGDTITFTYMADVDYSKIAVSGAASFEEMGNTVQLSGDSDPVDNKAEYHQKEVVFSDILKSVQGPGRRYREGGKEYQDITWTIDTNKTKLISLRGTDITDSSRAYEDGKDDPKEISIPMEYAGDGITVNVYEWNADRSESVLRETREISWKDLGISSGASSSETWTYHVPESDGIFEYEINYKTRADVTDLAANALVQNTASSMGGTDKASVLLHPKGTGLGVSKRVVSQTEDETTWEITVTADDVANGYNQRLVLEEMLPVKWIKDTDGKQYTFRDTYKEGSLKVYGLQDSESYSTFVSEFPQESSEKPDPSLPYSQRLERNNYRYSVTDASGKVTYPVDDWNYNSVFVEFYQDADKTVRGLAAPEDGSDTRSLRIRLTTINDPDWTRVAWNTKGYNAAYWELKHQNHAYANTSHAIAEAVVSGNRLIKTVKDSKSWIMQANWFDKKYGLGELGSTRIPVYRFETYVGGKYPGSTVVIDDLFDTDLFQLYTYEFRAGNTTHYANAVSTHKDSSGNPAGCWNEGEYSSSAVEIDGGVRFTIGEMPLKADGTAYPFYGVDYRLIPKSPEAFKTLQRLALKDGGIYHFLNTAKSGDLTDSDYGAVTILPEYRPVVKSDPTTPDTNNRVSYSIVLNQQKDRLNDGLPIVMEDEFQNLSVDYSSIKIETEPAGREDQVSYDYSGNVGSFTIPDETKVTISYIALVVAPADTEWTTSGGDQSESATVTVSNVASMLGWKEGGTKELKISKGAEATNFRIRAFKYGSGHMESGLNGAVFGLYTLEDGEYVPVKYKKGDNSGKEVQFTTTTQYMLDSVIQSGISGMYQSEIDAMPDDKFLSLLNYDEEKYKSASAVRKALTRLDGYADVQLNQDRDGVYLDDKRAYYLREEETPDGYTKDSSVEYYSFTFSKDPDYQEGAWQYYNNDILKIRNNPTTGSVILRKSLDGNYLLSDEQKAALRFTLDKRTSVQNDEWQAVSGAEGLTYDQLADGMNIEGISAGEYRVVETLAGSDEGSDGSGIIPGFVNHTVSFTVDETDSRLTDGEVRFEISQDDINKGVTHIVALTDTYEQSVVNLKAEKNWVDAEGVEKAPDNASVELGIFVLSGDGSGNLIIPDDAEPVSTITLDGKPDITSRKDTGEIYAWTANWGALPEKDDSGNIIQYAVKELRGVDGYEAVYGDAVAGTDSGPEYDVQTYSLFGIILNPARVTNVQEGFEGSELPHTGGIGTTIFYILGSLLIISGGIYFISRRRIK